MKEMKIEAVGNTKEQAEMALAYKRADINAKMNAVFSDVACYGNFELGYKLVQHFRPAI